MTHKLIGLIVNPVAGMGGSVGLKGTDGKKMYVKALALGAEPVTPKKCRELLCQIKHKEFIKLLAAPGVMGEKYLEGFEFPIKVIGELGEGEGRALIFYGHYDTVEAFKGWTKDPFGGEIINDKLEISSLRSQFE